MMGKTHIFIGTAMALALTMPDTSIGILTAAAGGALGGMMPDTDLDSPKNIKDVNTKATAGTIVAVCFAIDFLFRCGIIESMKNSNPTVMLIGLVLFVILYFIGAASDHRGFTHSILATVIYTAVIGLMCRPLVIPFAIGYASHILLDCTNKKKVRVFFPAKNGVRFKMFYASKKANIVFYYIGIICTTLLALISFIRMIMR